MSLKGKVAIVTGGNSGIGMAIVLELAQAGCERRHRLRLAPGSDRGARKASRRAGRQGDRRRRRREQGGRPGESHRRGGEAVRPGRRHGQQRRRRNPHVRARHDRSPVRKSARDQSQERVLRHAAGREADDQAGRGRPDHQHHVGPRRLADARQHGLLPVEGRHADAHAHGRRRARAAQHLGGRRRPGRGGDADQPLDDEGPRADEKARRCHSARPDGQAGRNRQRRRRSWPATERATSRRRRSLPTAASCRAARGCN